jgi:hypothetical protein
MNHYPNFEFDTSSSSREYTSAQHNEPDVDVIQSRMMALRELARAQRKKRAHPQKLQKSFCF